MNQVNQTQDNGNGTKRQLAPIAAVREQLGQMGAQFRAALPEHISVDRFSRVVMTAVQNNPELLECDQRSLWNAAMKAAQDGLLPDGREGAITVRKDWKSNIKNALWQPMISGIRKKARNSGEISTWDAHVVFENDLFDYELGDDPHIRHKPALTNRGAIVAAYSVCTLKSGEKTREIMSIEQMHEVRDRYSDGWRAFKAGYIKSTPWATSEEEMCRKTVARRHSKVIPMSSDLDALIRRDDSRQVEDEVAAPRIMASPAERMKTDLEALAAGGNGGPSNEDKHWETAARAEATPPHDPETGEIISDEMAARAQHEAALNDPSGEKAGELLGHQLEERAAAWERNHTDSDQAKKERAATATSGTTSMYDKERAKLAAKASK